MHHATCMAYLPGLVGTGVSRGSNGINGGGVLWSSMEIPACAQPIGSMQAYITTVKPGYKQSNWIADSIAYSEALLISGYIHILRNLAKIIAYINLLLPGLLSSKENPFMTAKKLNKILVSILLLLLMKSYFI